MRFRRRTRGRLDEAVIDVTSLIDAAFILIIFLLVTTSFKRKDHAFDVALPTAFMPAAILRAARGQRWKGGRARRRRCARRGGRRS